MTAQEVWNRLTPACRTLLILLDQYINQRTGGVEGETLSERFAKDRNAGNIDGIIACRILDRIDPGHCDRAIQHGSQDL